MNIFRLCLLSAMAVPAIAREPLTHLHAVQQALKTSPVIQAATERERAAEYALWEAIGYRLPSVQLMEMGVRTTNPAESFAFTMNQERFSMAQFADPARDPNNPDASNTYVTRAEASLPIFTGGMLHARTRQAKFMLDAARADRRWAEHEVTFHTIEGWLNLTRARENVDLMERSLETARTHLRQTQDYRDAGLIVPSDVLRAEVYVSELEEWRVRAINGERLAQAALNFAMGVPQTNSYSTGDLPAIDSLQVELETWLEAADQRRPDLQAARLKTKAVAKEKSVSLAGFLPEIGIVGRYDLYDDEVFGDNGESWALMGVAKWNIFRGGVDYANWQRNRHTARAHQSDVSRFREGVALEVRQAFGDHTAARLRQSAAAKTRQSGRENLRIIEERYQQGVVKITDLLDAQTALRELEVRELEARYDYNLSWYRLRLAAGESPIEIATEEQ